MDTFSWAKPAGLYGCEFIIVINLLSSLFPPLRFVFVGAAPVGQALIEKFKEKAPECVFREGQ